MKKIVVFFFAFILFGFQSGISQDTLKNITLNDIWTKYAFYPKSIHGLKSLKNGEQFAEVKNNAIVVYDFKTGDSVTTLVDGNKLIPEGKEKPIKISSYKISEDETRFLFPTETKRIYRHSTESVYYVWNTKTAELQKLSDGKQRLADFSPDGTKVAFVRDNNIFIKNLETGTETQVTSDGKVIHIINGTCDWVYEEEFGFTKAFFWAPDGRKIAFYRFDETHVKEYTLTYYNDLYPELYTYKYPVAGEDNSLVDIYVYDLENEKTVHMDTGEETDQYIPRIKWTQDPDILSVQRLNRLQNHLEILLCDAYTGNSRVMYSEDNKWYIDITDNLIFLPGNEQYIITSEMDGYNHIYLYNIRSGLVRQLTSGKWDVMTIYGYDENKKRVYFQSAQISPLNREVAYVNLKGKGKIISGKAGTNRATFAKNFNYFINNWSDANTPPVITLNKADGKLVRVLEDNHELVEKLKGYRVSPKEFFTISSPAFTLPDSLVVSLNAWKIMPYDFDPSKKYPVLLTIYGGPGAQTVLNSWGYFNYMWYQMLAEQGIMIVSVDNRGTGARSELFKKMTYLELGKYETLDYIETAKYLDSLPYVDSSKLAIFGWSYGGFMSSNMITQGADWYSTAIAVAPVTNWRYYDNIYTERFMRKPQDNASGYDDNSPINHVDKLKGHYLLIHGSADDNVHFQNSMDMITALVKANKQFDLFVYPNKNHSIYGGNTRYHLYKKMTDFLGKHLLNEK